MNFRLLVIVAAIVAVIGGAAYYFGQERKALQSDAYQGGPLLPGLAERINDADKIRLESQEGGVVELVRGEDGWRVPTVHGYPANTERVTGILKRIVSLETVEPKTAKPENHARLNLDDPAGEFSLALRLTASAGADALADLVVGLNRGAEEGGGLFVRLWGDDQTWLASGEFKPRRRALDLLNRNIVNVDGRRIQSAQIRHPAPGAAAGGAIAELIVVAKAAPDQEAYQLSATLPEGFTAKPDHELSAVARISDFLIFEAVQPADQAAFDHPVVSIYETFDGLRLVFRAQEQGDGDIWATVVAEAGPRWQGLDAYLEAHKGKDSEPGRIADQFKTPEDIAAEIAEINKTADGWAYRLTDYKIKRLTVTSADVSDAPEKPAEEPKQAQ